MKYKIISPALGTILFVFLLFAGERIARADSVITNCANDSQLTTALASGGNITFNCGTATITFSGQKTINVNTTIDGGGKITLTGGNTTRLFWVSSGKALTLKNLVLTNGYAGNSYGGCIYVDGSTLVVQNSTIQNCSTNDYAGGAIVSPNGSVTLDGVVMQNNSASSGGAVSATGSVTILNSQFLGNSATNVGGALSLNATVVIDQSKFSGNNAPAGGHDGQGGAIYAGGNLAIHASTLVGNIADIGGAIYMRSGSQLTIDLGSTVSGNGGDAGVGGAISNSGTAILDRVTLANNGDEYAGAIYNNGTLTLTNSTVSKNDSLEGGGISNAGTATLTNVTLSENNGSTYGAIRNTGTITLKNTLIAKGTSGTNCSGSFGGSFNLSDDGSCGFGAGRDYVTFNLPPLSYNGSSILTHLPLPGSIAVDNGTNNGAPATDARGYARPQGGAADVGAVEVCAVKPVKPTLKSPGNNAKYKGIQVALNWEVASCADGYKITVKDTATGKKVQGGKTDYIKFTTNNLTKGKTYKWFVQACNTIGCTKSDTWKFTVK